MTSVLPEDERKPAKKQLMTDVQAKEETRSFLNFSRGNLSISHSNLEQGFNKQRPRFRRNTILSAAGLLVSLLCLGLATWTVHCSQANAREIELLKWQVGNLQRRIRQEDLLDKLKAFEEQLYAEELPEEEDAGEADIDNSYYDSNYEDEPGDFSGEYQTPAYGSRPSDFPNSSAILKPVPTPPDPVPKTNLVEEYITSLQKGEPKRAHHQTKPKVTHEDKNPREDNTDKEKVAKHRRDVRDLDWTAATNKLKRSVSERSEETLVTSTHRRGNRNQTRRILASVLRGRENGEVDSSRRNQTGNWDRHPPKKYYGRHLDDSAAQLSRTSKNLGEDARDNQESPQISQRSRGLSRRHLRAPRQVYAVHYGADSTLFSEEDEHTGNGRARHGEGVFKAWRASDWVPELGMNKYFALAGDGRLAVHEPGLYLVYAQIHYLDEHDENGFHLLVNGRPILQCMIYSPGTGHKSRSCFSAQVTLLHAGDVLLLKDVGSDRYTLFQHDKSFFGLVKLGEPRLQRHSVQQPVHQ